MANTTKNKFNNLIKLEQSILTVIKKLLKKKIVFQFDPTFIDFCCLELKSSEMEIYKAIYSLIQQKILVPGSTLTREQILKNSSRALIFETIQKHPGIHIRELCMTLNMSSGVVRAHLKVLENFDYIRRKKCDTPKLVLLFSKDFTKNYDEFFIISKNENDLRILHCLRNQQLSLSELSTQLTLHHSTIQYHLKKLELLDLIIRIQENQNIKYAFNKAKLNAFIEFLRKFQGFNNLK